MKASMSTALLVALLALPLSVAAGAPAGDPAALVRDLAARSACWLAPPDSLETLEYDFLLGSEVTRIRAGRGGPRRAAAWMGATLHAGFQALVREPGMFAIELKREPGAKTLTLVARLKDEKGSLRVEVGNGVENSWRGYFSHGARGTSIVVDAERLVPLEEQTGGTIVRYADWQNIGKDRWVPRRVDVLNGSVHYRMSFAWLGEAVWLLRSSESIAPEGTVRLTRTRNAIANGRHVDVLPTDAETRSQAAAQAILAMLDHNRPWLDGGANGVGWKPAFNTLSYTFHTERQDVREAAAIDRSGELVAEVVHDGQGKMKDRLGDRQVALNTREFASSRRGERFARIHGRPERRRDRPFDLALKQYARIGCQLDLPLFRYREQLESAAIEVKDGDWRGRPCRVATVSLPGGDTYLGFGTMFAFTSWSYVHHTRPGKEVLFIDPDRHVLVHEVLVNWSDGRAFEVDFADYLEVEPGQWAPLSIRIESKDYFVCEYRFQLVAGKHWMLKEVVSWFKPEEKSRGVIEDVRVDGDRSLLDDAMRQVRATRALFGGEGEPDLRVNVATVPFALGRATRLGPYEVHVAMQDDYTVALSASTANQDAPGTVPVCFLDERGRLLFAPSVTLKDQAGARRGSVAIRGSIAWRQVRSIVVPPGNASAARQAIAVVPLRWGEAIPVNIPDARQGSLPDYGEKQPRDALTRAFQVRAERHGDGTAKVVLDVVSIDGMHEFRLDLAAALLDRSGELLASGGLSTDIRVESRAVEKRYTIAMGKLREGGVPAFVAIGIVPGDVIASTMGSRWFWYTSSEAAFDGAALLASPDEGSRRTGLDALARKETNRAIRHEFLGDRDDERFVGDGPYSRHTLLRPLAGSLARIAREPGPADVRADAARFLAYSEAKGVAEALRPLAGDADPRVREAAAIGLTFLGQADHLETLRSIVSRTYPEDRPPSRWQMVRLEEDPLIALASQHLDAAVDILGAALLGDIKSLRLAQGTGTPPQAYLEGRLNRATAVCRLLGRTGNPRAARWLIAADDLVAGRADLAAHFPRHELAESMLKFLDQVKDRIGDELETGGAAATWANALSRIHDPDFVPSVRAMLRRTDLTESDKYSAVQYCWNLGTPQAVDVLREAYDRRVMESEPWYWMRLCEALAACGDGRGLPDAFDVLVDLERPAEPPADEQNRRSWESARDSRKREAEAVFDRATKEALAAFLGRKADAASPDERRLVLRLLWRLPEVPGAYTPILPAWANSPDPKAAELARRLLEREGSS
jgi:hypothetical protein